MKVGVQLPEVEREVTWGEVVDIARAAEDCGFDSIWVGDHLLYRDDLGSSGPWEAWTSLAALAQETNRVELGPLVAATSFHSPAMIAKMASTVDEISEGRLILGLGAGWNRVEYDAFGFPFDHRVSRFDEAFTIIRTLIRDGHIDFEGAYYTHRDMELLPPARPDMKILLGSNGPRMLRIGAPHVDMWNSWFVWFGNRPEGLASLLDELSAACHDTGRDPSTVEKTAAVLVELERGSGRRAGSEERPEAPPIRGSHEEIAERLGAFAAAGISHLQLVVDPIDTAAVEELALVRALLDGYG
ncbi:MAG: LLM class flavin-dependent oxidoreductase [Acidimicrobiia bacterium]|jgi:alkanesulfonate monooxygenase SsuD/methylene tetrahydromethanopterin reductase-like flavin-dependent oxidoreductase (luciferase family)